MKRTPGITPNNKHWLALIVLLALDWVNSFLFFSIMPDAAHDS